MGKIRLLALLGLFVLLGRSLGAPPPAACPPAAAQVFAAQVDARSENLLVAMIYRDEVASTRDMDEVMREASSGDSTLLLSAVQNAAPGTRTRHEDLDAHCH